MTRPMEPLKLFLTLLLFWLLLNGSLALGTIGVGIVVVAVIVVFFRETLSFLSGHKLTPEAIWTTVLYVLYFLKELVKANLQMASIVLKPQLPIHPAIVCTNVKLTNPVARLLLANSITLTPGTLSVEYEGDKLYVHWVVSEGIDCETATTAIVAGFERYLEKMYD